MLCGFVAIAALALPNLPSAAAPGTFDLIHNFCTLPVGCRDGVNPAANLVMDHAGNLYGTTVDGGAQQAGTVFKLTPIPGQIRWKEQILYNFCALDDCADGSSPEGALIVDTSGNLYGTTSSGGTANNNGTIFELSPVAGRNLWSEKVLYSFCSNDSACTDGSQPEAGLTYAGAASGAAYDGISTLYGTAAMGGKHGSGAAFTFSRLNRGSWVERPIYEFCSERLEACADGFNPVTRLLVGSAGTLYGTTVFGGANQEGTAFRLKFNSGARLWTETVLHNFCALANCADGKRPSSALVMDGQGNLYGTTFFGGTGVFCSQIACGTIYAISPSGDESVVYNFCSKAACGDGSIPQGDLAMNESGGIFGATRGYYASNILFELTGKSLTVLHNFCSNDPNCLGGSIQQGVIMDSSGNLFGIAYQHGRSTYGSVFEWSP